MFLKFLFRSFGTAVALTLLATAGQAATIKTVLVGNPGNANDTTGYGGVAYSYRMGKYEVTNAQYCDFLNAKAVTDTYGLYNEDMSSNALGGIDRSGSLGSYSYTVKSGYENMPVVYVSWLDAIRFVNWLQNGQGSGSTESGTYTITGGGHNSGTVAVPAAATRATWTAADPHWVLPSLNEWYKAAYHQPAAQGGDTDDYWLYPTGTNSEPYSDQPPGSGAPVQGNTANFYKNDGVANGYDDGYAVTGSTSFVYTQNYLTNVGAYTQSDSFYGTFDQAANLAEWNEADIYGDGSYRGLRGHEWASIMPSYYMAASHDYSGTIASTEFYRIGFRVASVPEPGTTVLLVGGAIAGLIWSRWRRIA